MGQATGETDLNICQNKTSRHVVLNKTFDLFLFEMPDLFNCVCTLQINEGLLFASHNLESLQHPCGCRRDLALTCECQTRVQTTYPGRRRSCPWPGSSCCSPHKPFCRRLPGWPTCRRWRSAGFLPPELPGNVHPGIWFPDGERLDEHLFGGRDTSTFVTAWRRPAGLGD